MIFIAYKGTRGFNFGDFCTYVLNGWPLIEVYEPFCSKDKESDIIENIKAEFNKPYKNINKHYTKPPSS